MTGTDGLSDEVINAITHENAMRLFDFAPFAHRSKAESTVGALRRAASVAGVNTEPRSMRTRAQTMGSVAGAQQDLLTPSRI
jgi:hypothetical protein